MITGWMVRAKVGGRYKHVNVGELGEADFNAWVATLDVYRLRMWLKAFRGLVRGGPMNLDDWPSCPKCSQTAITVSGDEKVQAECSKGHSWVVRDDR